MEQHFYKSTGISLITGAMLIIITMVLHPAGGSIERIIHISKSITITHALAIFSLPFILFGFYGLSKTLSSKYHLSFLGFIIIGFGLIAAMFAALYNGLALPYFLGRYADDLPANLETLKLISNFSFAINKSLDYIFMTACCLSIFVYSLVIIRTGSISKWIGYFGILILLFAFIGVLSGFVFTSLTGFRVFTFSLAGWILVSGNALIKYQ